MAIRKLFTSSEDLNNTIEVIYDRGLSSVVVLVTGWETDAASRVRLPMAADDAIALATELTTYAYKARQDAKKAAGGQNG